MTHNGQWLVNIVNYNKYPVTFQIDGIPTQGRIDLITMAPLDENITLQPLETCLVSAEMD